jgi:hypothetical protein
LQLAEEVLAGTVDAAVITLRSTTKIFLSKSCDEIVVATQQSASVIPTKRSAFQISEMLQGNKSVGPLLQNEAVNVTLQLGRLPPSACT